MAARLSTLLRYVVDVRTLALLAGAVCTPVALGVSLQLWPLWAPMLLYALLTAVFAYRRPESGWLWGLWTTGGHVLALLLVAILNVLASEATGFAGSGTWPFLRVAGLFGLAPAFVGACLGGAAVGVLAKARYELFVLIIGAIVLLSGLAVLLV